MRLPCKTRAFLAALAACGLSLLAQSGLAELGGSVRDAAGLPVANAAITLHGVATGTASRLRTTPSGEFQFLALPPGQYSLTAEMDGFRPLRHSAIELRLGDRLRLDLRLELGEVSEVLEVRAETPLLRASAGATGFVVEQKKVVTLPLDGRNFVPLIALSPGVNLPPGDVLPRINGSRPRVSEYIYDGISVLQPEPGQVAFYPIIDAIDEFRVETNSYSAEYGRSNGGVIMVNQKSGSQRVCTARCSSSSATKR